MSAPTNTDSAPRWTWIYRLSWLACRLVTFVYFRAHSRNPENVPSTGSVLLAANHASFIDPPLIGAWVGRPINYLARESLFHNRFMHWLLVNLNCVPVDRDGGGAAGLKTILGRLQRGGGILLFPEGTRSPDGQIQPARAGVGLAIIKSRAPVVPVRVCGTFEAYSRFHIIPRPRRVSVHYGAPLDFSDLRSEAESCDKNRLKAIYQEAADRVMAAIRDLA